jgi:pyruvate dehydrogenase (quinone)
MLMSKKVAQVIVETLQSAGVKNCYGIVGDTLNTFAKRVPLVVGATVENEHHLQAKAEKLGHLLAQNIEH